MRKQLKEWLKEHPIPGKMLWDSEAKVQFASLLELEKFIKIGDSTAVLWVIGQHQSKSIVLPVVEIKTPKRGLTVYARNNFDSWAVSVICEAPVHRLNTNGMHFENLGIQYYEGFERSGAPVFGGYMANNSQFSFFCSAEPDELQKMIKKIIRS